jgi:hypothetical protein
MGGRQLRGPGLPRCPYSRLKPLHLSAIIPHGRIVVWSPYQSRPLSLRHDMSYFRTMVLLAVLTALFMAVGYLIGGQ